MSAVGFELRPYFPFVKKLPALGEGEHLTSFRSSLDVPEVSLFVLPLPWGKKDFPREWRTDLIFRDCVGALLNDAGLGDVSVNFLLDVAEGTQQYTGSGRVSFQVDDTSEGQKAKRAVEMLRGLNGRVVVRLPYSDWKNGRSPLQSYLYFLEFPLPKSEEFLLPKPDGSAKLDFDEIVDALRIEDSPRPGALDIVEKRPNFFNRNFWRTVLLHWNGLKEKISQDLNSLSAAKDVRSSLEEYVQEMQEQINHIDSLMKKMDGGEKIPLALARQHWELFLQKQESFIRKLRRSNARLIMTQFDPAFKEMNFLMMRAGLGVRFFLTPLCQKT